MVGGILLLAPPTAANRITPPQATALHTSQRTLTLTSHSNHRHCPLQAATQPVHY
jgi:hypothetical protein